jgi:PTH1 family peptidyl-tRNA hydrolase
VKPRDNALSNILESLFDKLKSNPEPAVEAERPGLTPYLIVGLGNPGREYRGTRHNIGFMLLDHLAERLGVTFSRLESQALVAKADYAGKRIVLAKPQTYMNLSGQPVGALLHYYKIPHSQLLVAYDDVDLPLGTLRIRPGGGSAGQKGMASIIERLGTQEFPRLRLGIDRPPGKMPAAAYVLQDFSSAQQPIVSAAVERAADAVFLFVSEGLEAAMNRYNGSGVTNGAE